MSSLAGAFAIPALLSTGAALMSPALALIRWLQEKSVNHRYLDEMKRSGELLEFIQRCPEMQVAAGDSESAVVMQAREELQQSLRRISVLLARKVTQVAPGEEMAWPRRMFLLYAPRTLVATGLHALFYLENALVLLMLIGVGYNEQADAFLWTEYERWYFHNPIFVLSMLSWALQILLLWYIAITKDRWDKTLPERPKPRTKSFLTQTPISGRDLLGRALLIWSIWVGIILPLMLDGAVERFMKTFPMGAAILGVAPAPTLWRQLLSWAVAVMTPIVAYLWAQAEFGLRGKSVSIRFPHNLRFFYSAPRWREVFSQLTIVAGVVELFTYSVLLCRYFPAMLAVIPADARPDVGRGILFPVIGEFVSILFVLYGSYRMALISYMRWRESTGCSEQQARGVSAQSNQGD